MMGDYQPQLLNFYNQQQLAVEDIKYYNDEDDEILDENILDNSTGMDSSLEMSPSTDHSRRHSYSVSSAIYSPTNPTWPQDMQRTASNNVPFGDHSTNFMKLQNHATFAPTNQWNLDPTSGTCTPMAPYDGLHGDFDGHVNMAAATFPRIQGQTPFSNNGAQVTLFTPNTTANTSTPSSPQKDWTSDSVEGRCMPRRLNNNTSPVFRSRSPLLRRDGIRKKNARFDIPAERNLANIDNLINESLDEQEIKELKQQKRLLRNRQAALDSRQRKKMHTERLEDEKKQYTGLIQELEQDIDSQKQQIEDMFLQMQEMQQQIAELEHEKEQIVHNHTQETGELRKRNNVLKEKLLQLENTAMSAAPSSTGYELADFDALNMGTWDFLDHNSQLKPEPMAASKAPQRATATSDPEKSAAQGVLMMILLFGAYVATRGQASGLPQMSEDVKAASASLLEDAFKDAGVSSNTGSHTMSAAPPMVSMFAGNDNMWSGGATGHLNPNDLSLFGSYADGLSLATEDQKHDQLFGLNSAQYNGVSSPSFLSSMPDRDIEGQAQGMSQGRRNIADTLRAMRLKHKGKSAADVYTRSILWEQVPQDVVRNFAKLVEEQGGSH